MGSVIPFNPLDKKNLALSIESAVARACPVPLNCLERFEGSGVYALYYSGDFYAYAPLIQASKSGQELPIYVGKADSKGKRKGDFLEDEPSGTSLYNRLSDHAKSLEQAQNLALEDFTCRYLVVDDLWISLGESLLISKYSPVWNVLIEGFGNHDPGKGRHAGARPLWDTLHPGRPWAQKLPQNASTAEAIGQDALQYLQSRISATASSSDTTIDDS